MTAVNNVKCLAVAIAAASLGIGSAAMATANVALSADGASFVSASSAISLTGYNVATSEANVLTNTPTAAYFNGDTRFIFGGAPDFTQDIVIDLGAVYKLSSFAATFGATDRTPTGLTVAVSNTDGGFTPVVATTATTDAGAEYVVAPASAVGGRFVEYTFGAPSGQYGDAGSGISQLFAVAVPEPATWAMMLVGLGMIGFAARRRRNVSVTYA